MSLRSFPRAAQLGLLALLLCDSFVASGGTAPEGAIAPGEATPAVNMAPVIVREDPLPKMLTHEVLDSLYRPLNGGKIELAPDGKHVAFTTHAGDKILLLIVDVDHPEVVRSIMVNIDAVPARSEDAAKTPARVRDLKWVDAQRLVFASSSHEIVAVDADGKNGGTIVDENNFEGFAPRLIALPPRDPNHIIVQAFQRASVGLDSFNLGIRVDHHTQKTERIWQLAARDGSPVVDRDGQLRLLHQTDSVRPLETWSYRLPDKDATWAGLEKLLGKEIGPSFRIVPETYYGHRSFPLGFGYSPSLLYYASNLGRNTFGIYSVDLRTQQRAPVLENDEFDAAGTSSVLNDRSLVFDRASRQLVGVRLSGLEPQTIWLDPQLAAVQRQFDEHFPRHSLQLLQWDDARTRFLVLASGSAEPGQYYIYRPQDHSMTEIVRRTGWINPEEIHPTAFAFTTGDGVKLTGYVTLPRHPRISPAPLLVYLHDGPMQREEPEFNRRAQAMAQMGFIVLRLNYRGSAGFGLAHLNAIRRGFDRMPLEDVHAALAWLATSHPFNPRRVALIGQGFGGYLALRALELFPDDFRCAIAIDPLADLRLWINSTTLAANGPGLRASSPFPGSSGRLETSIAQTADYGADGTPPPAERPSLVSQSAVRGFRPSPLESATRRRFFLGPDAIPAPSAMDDLSKITKPLLILTDEIDAETGGQSARLLDRLAEKKIAHAHEKISDEFIRELPEAQFATYDKIEEFLNLNVYSYRVDVGDAKMKN